MLATATAPNAAVTIVQIYIPATLAMIMLAMGLGLTLKDFTLIVEHPRAVLLGTLSQLIFLPAIGFGLAYALGLPGPLAVGVVLLTICPGGPSSNLYTNVARGDTALSVSLTAISGVLTMFTIPFIASLAITAFMGKSTTLTMPIGDTMVYLLLIVGMPLGCGMVIRGMSTELALTGEKWVKRLAIFMLVGLIIGAVAKEWSRIGDYMVDLGPLTLALSLGAMALGYGLAKLGRLSERQSVTITIEVGMQNAALAMGLATAQLGSEVIAMPAVIYGILAYFTCLIPVFWGRRKVPALATLEPASD